MLLELTPDIQLHVVTKRRSGLGVTQWEINVMRVSGNNANRYVKCMYGLLRHKST